MAAFQSTAAAPVRRFSDEFECEDSPIGDGATCRVFRCWRKQEFVETPFIWRGSASTSRVAIKGSFFGWQEEQLMVWNAVNRQHEATIPLPIGTHEFKFFVDGQWMCSDAHPLTTQQLCKEEQNNFVQVLPSARFCLPHPANQQFSHPLRMYAVKKYFGRLKSDMMREVQNLQSMRHEHVVNVHDWFVDADDGSLCLVTELCEGGNLHEALSSFRGRFPPAFLKQVFKQIFLAMDFCHRSHMIHGDMKLAQVLLKRPVALHPPSSTSGPDVPRPPTVHVKVADFGDSRFSLRHTMDSSSTGTIGYRAPELLLNEVSTTAADMFSIGIMLARCLDLGVPPFKCNHQVMLKDKPCCIFAYAKDVDNPANLGCCCPINGQYPPTLVKSGSKDNDLLRKPRANGTSARGVNYQTVNVCDAFWDDWAHRKGCALQPLLALDLVRRLCKRLPNERLSAFQALNHPWLRSDACDFFRPQPQRTILCTYKPPPSCRYASRPGQSSALCSCPMLKKFGFCAFAHPPEDLKTNARSSADAVESSPVGPELWMAQLSSVSSMLQLQPAEGQHVRLLRHNCEGEIGWSCVQIHDTENGLCEEGLIASCCIGLPPSAADDWQPPTYDVDTHKFPSVFKQWQPADFRCSLGGDGSGARAAVAWEADMQNLSLLKNISSSPHLADGVIGSHLSAFPLEAAALEGSLQPLVGLICSTKPLLVIDGLKLLAMQLKDVNVCASMVRCGIIQHVRACVDTWDKSRSSGGTAADDSPGAVAAASSDGPDDMFFDELCARVCDLLVVICHHACSAASSSVWCVACHDVRSARLRCKPSPERTDSVWVEPAAYVKNGERVTMIRQEKHDDGTEWSWIRSEQGKEGYILRARLQERRLQSAIFDSVAESEWFFHLVHIMAENAYADKVHGIIVLLLSASLSCDKILHSFVSARPSCSIVDILSAGLESCAVAVGSCATIKVMLRVLHFQMIDGDSGTVLPMSSWVVAAQRVLNCMHANMFETEPVTPLVIEELGASFEFLQRLLSWSAAERVVVHQLLPSRAFSKRRIGEDVTFLAALQSILNVIAVGGTGGGLSRVMIARVEPAEHQVGRFPVSSLTSLAHVLLSHHLKVRPV